MADKLDMSLDDIIKQNKTQRGRGRGGRANQRGGRRGRGQQSRRGSGGGVYRGGVQRNRGGSAGGFNQQQRTRDVPDVWQHDMYDGASSTPARRGGSTPSGGSGKLLVSNLDFGVNDSDIQELFSEFGALVKAAVHFDRSGRSLGTAEVIYQRRTDAVKALKQYNNVPLDGRPMNIQLVGAPAVGSANSRLGTRGGGVRQTGGYRGGSRGGRGGNRGRGGRGGREKKDLPTVEDLDAQLDAYNAKMDTS
ncbi:THO complex subunit 4-like [Physella acuta]|uniref:THO complex subunit 4-like n=1 Tax=Physella acuta TaxID=109671 RepID=UPI0027DD903F|nr:THO complex subunit 4-like [Physella acuta]